MAREDGWNEEVAGALVEVAGHLPDARLGKMFGHPALYAGGKLFACAYGDGVALKLPADVVGLLVQEDGFEPFQPYGKAGMREWVLARATDRESVHGRAELFRRAARFVATDQRRDQERRAGRDV